MERKNNHNFNLPIFEQIAVHEIIKDAEITGLFTGESVGEILKKRHEQVSRIARHRMNVQLMVEDNLCSPINK